MGGMDQKGKVSILRMDYRAACRQGWNFHNEQAQAFTSRQAALDYARRLRLPNQETGVIKGQGGGFALWCVGTKRKKVAL